MLTAKHSLMASSPTVNDPCNLSSLAPTPLPCDRSTSFHLSASLPVHHLSSHLTNAMSQHVPSSFSPPPSSSLSIADCGSATSSASSPVNPLSVSAISSTGGAGGPDDVIDGISYSSPTIESKFVNSPSSPSASDATADEEVDEAENEETQTEAEDLASSGLRTVMHSAAALAAAEFAKQLSSVYGRNKRKNFKPRCLADDEDDLEVDLSKPQNQVTTDQGKKKSTTEPLHTDNSHRNSSSPCIDESSHQSVLTNSPSVDMAVTTIVAASNGGDKVGDHQQPLDLTAQEQLHRQRQFAELLLMKNVRNLSVLYPQLAALSENMLLQSAAAVAAAEVSEISSSPPPPPSQQISSSSSSEMTENISASTAQLSPQPTEMESNESNNEQTTIEQLALHLHYLRALQQQEQTTTITTKNNNHHYENSGNESTTAEFATTNKMTSNSGGDAASSSESDDQESQTSLSESVCKNGIDALVENGLTVTVVDVCKDNNNKNHQSTTNLQSQSPSKAFNTESIGIDDRLKMLQNFYQLHFLEQQMKVQQQNSNEKLDHCTTAVGGGGAQISDDEKRQPLPYQASLKTLNTSRMSELSRKVQPLPQHSQQPTTIAAKSAGGNSSTTKSDNYIAEMFKTKVMNASKSTSRRPLSSWKQSISACGPGPAPWVDKNTLQSLGIQGELIDKCGPIDYTHYVKRFGNATECGSALCKELNYREHFHCNALSCNSRVFMKKEEMIRHFKWHKKRDESLTHGFLRCSPSDNCVERFRNCPHHRKQTHYHCLKRGCDKVYISTSDVQMHANYHRKDTAIIQEGFQRFRATENCLMEGCAFFGQKTTHFHCRRDNCNHTFKNKADMEKHKSYHIRDEQLARDGFKKFLKHETCTFENCRSSRVCNHIHCIRPGCTHVLHSTGQLYPHKRKHERRENELAYRKYRLAQAIRRSASTGLDRTDPVVLSIGTETLEHLSGSGNGSEDDSVIDSLAAKLPLAQFSIIPLEDILGEIYESRCLKYIHRHSYVSHQCHFEMQDHNNQMELGAKLENEHYHCSECKLCWLEYVHVFEHAKKHSIQEEATLLLLEETNDIAVCTVECAFHQTNERHLHCRMFACQFTISMSDRTLRKLEHYKLHEDQQCQFVQLPDEIGTKATVTNASTNFSINGQSLRSRLNIEQLLRLKMDSSGSSHGGSATAGGAAGQKMSGLMFGNETTSISSKRSHNSPTLQVFPTGTTLTSVDGLPVLKRKRGRPPKNRSNEALNIQPRGISKQNQQTLNIASQHPFASVGKLGQMTTFDLAAAINTPFKHNNVIANSIQKRQQKQQLESATDASQKTIPIPLIMPYFKSAVQHGFYVFDDEAPCPDMSCIYFGQKHYHCSKPRCYYITNREQVLLMHSRDFHDSIDIMEGFAYYDENIDCKMANCTSSKSYNHFHCTRAGCGYSFVRYSAMAPHEEKHRQMSSKCSNPLSESRGDDDEQHSSSESAEMNEATLKAAMLQHIAQQQHHPDSIIDAWFQEQAKLSNFGLGLSNTTPNQTEITSQHNLYNESNPCNSPFCKLKRRAHFHCAVCNQAFSSLDRLLPHEFKHSQSMTAMANMSSRMAQQQTASSSAMYSPNNSMQAIASAMAAAAAAARVASDQTGGGPVDDISEEAQQQKLLLTSLQSQFAHNSAFANGFFQMLMNNWLSNSGSVTGSSLPPASAAAAAMIASANPAMMGTNLENLSNLQQQHQQVNNNLQNNKDRTSSSSSSSKKRDSFSSETSSSSELGTAKKKAKVDAGLIGKSNNEEHSNHSNGDRLSPTSLAKSSSSSFSEESSPNGYLRFRFNEDCDFPTCVYREHQTHFHCIRKDCGYSFCDRTRFVQHTARHERLDSLMGGDFQQYRSSVNCNQANCPYGVNSTAASSPGNSSNNAAVKTSHFHCLKCDYVCADTNKVVAHRRQHAKMDNINAAGFEKYSPTQDCENETCNYKLKQTHYHCSSCNYAVLGLSQMASHKFKHQQQQQQQ